MNITRIVVPAVPEELDAPHFDDETTIITARPVVPIARAKSVDRTRVSALILAGLLAAAGSGALGAFGIRSYESRRQNSAAAVIPTQTSDQPQPSQPESPSQNAAPATQETPAVSGPESASSLPGDTNTQTVTSNQPQELAIDKKDRGDGNTSKLSEASIVAATPASSDVTSADEPSHIVRPRRVHPDKERAVIPSPKAKATKIGKRGAGLIKEIFEGSGPP